MISRKWRGSTRLGATGKGFAPVEVLKPGEAPGSDLRAALSAHIESKLSGSAGGIATALATGDQGAISIADTQAMQRSGLAHLLSVSGLHVSAVTAVTMLIVMRLLALFPMLALRWRLPLIAAGAAAAAAIGYTWLTGAQVPTIRSCVAALMVLVALSLGREAITLRLVAAGAFFVLLLWPEALAGPSFQLSFAAVTAIIALHEHPRIRALFAKREEGRGRRLLRELGSLLLTGLVVELALIPIGLFHFHRAGVYGVLANIVAIPLTTFVIMPLEALALLLDLVGLGAPVWWLTQKALDLLLWLANTTASAPGAVAALPSMPGRRLCADGDRRAVDGVVAEPRALGGMGATRGGRALGLADARARPADHRRRAASRAPSRGRADGAAARPGGRLYTADACRERRSR